MVLLGGLWEWFSSLRKQKAIGDMQTTAQLYSGMITKKQINYNMLSLLFQQHWNFPCYISLITLSQREYINIFVFGKPETTRYLHLLYLKFFVFLPCSLQKENVLQPYAGRTPPLHHLWRFAFTRGFTRRPRGMKKTHPEESAFDSPSGKTLKQ